LRALCKDAWAVSETVPFSIRAPSPVCAAVPVPVPVPVCSLYSPETAVVLVGRIPYTGMAVPGVPVYGTVFSPICDVDPFRLFAPFKARYYDLYCLKFPSLQ
jgi:hypothetical protein